MVMITGCVQMPPNIEKPEKPVEQESSKETKYVKKKGIDKDKGFSVAPWDSQIPEYVSNAVNEINNNKY